MKQKLRIISSKDVWSPTGVGGSDSYVRRLTQGLRVIGYDVEHVFVEGGFGNFWGLRRHFRKLGKDQAENFVYRLSLYHRVMFIVYFQKKERTVSFIPFSTDGLRRYIVYMSYLLVGGKICVVSQSLFSDIKSLSNKRVSLLLPSVPEQFLSSRCTKKQKTVIFVGRIDNRKGADIVADLFDRLSPEFNCIMYGVHIPRDDGVMALRHRCLHSTWRYIEVSQNEYNDKLECSLKNWLDSATYFIQPYRSIGSTVDTPLLLLEAISRGCTVLTTNIIQTKFINPSFRLNIDSFVDDATSIIQDGREDYKLYDELLLSPKMQAKKLIEFINDV